MGPLETFRVVRSTTPTPSALHVSRRHTTAISAIQEMGEGVVIGVQGSRMRLVAFHEQHLAWVERTAGRVSLTR